MTDTGPYGITQHANAELTTADALVGERISPLPENATYGSPATFSTAPYKPPRHERPKTRLPRGPSGCLGKNGTCIVAVIRGTERCVFHTKQFQSELRRAAE